MIYENFQLFMEREILPKKVANPTHIRLDGNLSGGNRKVAGIFRHQGLTWKVHSDTHYEPLQKAYDAIVSGQVEDPFEQHPTKQEGNCLEMIQEIQCCLTNPKFKHLYIYQLKQKREKKWK